MRFKRYSKENLGDYSSAGLMFPASIVVGLAMGYFLDKQFGTEPILIIIFTLYGVAAGFWNLFKIARPTPKKNENNSPISTTKTNSNNKESRDKEPPSEDIKKKPVEHKNNGIDSQ